jgi:Phospholipase B
MKRVKNGICYVKNGWTYTSIFGEPYERGFAYGSLIYEDIKKVKEMLDFSIYDNFGVKWEFFIEASNKYFLPKIQKHFPEFYEEMKGVAEGCSSQGVHFSIEESVAWNNYLTLTDSWFGNMPEEESKKIRSGNSHHSASREGGSKDRCSAFIAVGDWTKDSKILVAHNNFSEFIDGQYCKYITDINPTQGHRILMLGFPGIIWSGTDFFVTSKGIIGTETTIGGFVPYENNYPISCRIRQAMQYGNTLDEYVEILLKENSGDYANSWLFGDINTNEILRIELGLKYSNVERTKNGYYIGFNSTYDPRIRNIECVDSGFHDIRRHQGARRVRLTDLMDKHKGKLDINTAKKIIGDHHDVYLNKTNKCSRTVCSHYDLDAREYMSDPSRPKPFEPRGAVDGNICDSNMAKNMSFLVRWGNSCGTSFNVSQFCNKNRQWKYLEPYLHNRLSQPWTVFSITKNTNKTLKVANKKRKTKKVYTIYNEKE